MADANIAIEALNRQQNHLLGNILYIVVGIIISTGLLTSVINSVRASKNDPESQASAPRRRPNHLTTWFRRRILLPALFGRKHIQPIGYYQFPTRGQTVMVVGYLLLNVVFVVTAYPAGRTVKAVADRTGYLSIVNMPMYFLFAGRNNVLIWITGWPQRDFQVFHKWIARISTLQAVVHSAGYGYWAAQNHWQVSSGPRSFDWFNGIAATVVVCVMICCSVMSIRRRYYELFLILHILCAILFLVFLNHHIAHPYNIYVWVSIAIWALDRVLRLVRLAIFNLHGRHTAKAKLIPGTSTIRLTIYPAIKDVGFAPGAHYFLYLPDRWCFWESHPFTAASWRPGGQTLPQAPSKVLVALQKFDGPTALPATTPEPSDGTTRKDTIIITSTTRRGPQKAKLTFLIHPRRGMTRNLLLRIMGSPTRSLSLPCVLEGPYGIARPVQAFATVLLIAGGVGVSTALPYLHAHLATPPSNRRFMLVWSVREGAMAEEVLRGVRGLGFRQDVGVRVFITRPKEKESWALPVGVRVKYERPKIEGLVVREAEVRRRGTTMAVVACGGAAVVDCARKGAVMALERAAGRKGMGEVVYWEEGYGW